MANSPLFVLEIDAAQERVIATDFSENIYGTRFRNGQYNGVFTDWAERRQNAAGLDHNRFTERNISTRMKPIKSEEGLIGRFKKN